MKNILLPIATSTLLVAATANAQSSCDSLNIVGLQYAPFTDTAMQVIVMNESQDIFGYPQFSLIDANGDTLVSEELNFFGIGWNTPSTHRMDLRPGQQLPPTPFSGTVSLLYFTGTGTPTCTWPIENEPLCPQEACTSFQIYLYNNSPAIGLVTDVFPWNITDDEGAIVASGSLAIDAADQQQDMVPACLPPGEYVLHMSQNGSEGTTFSLGVTQSELMTNGPSGTLSAGGAMDLSFTYYPVCVGLGMSIDEQIAVAPIMIVNDGQLKITDRNGSALGAVVVYDASGRAVHRTDAQTSSMTIDLSGNSPGPYLLGSMDARWPAMKFALQR